MPAIGYLGNGSPEGFATRLASFRQGLGETGYFEGRNVHIEFRWAYGHNDRLPAMAAELVQRRVTVLATPGGLAATRAAMAATTTIPIVFEMGPDPVASGVVANLNRPDGNVTGITSLNVQTGAKRFEALRELVPRATAVALLLNPINPNAETVTHDAENAAKNLGLRLQIVRAATVQELDSVFAELKKQKVDALAVTPDPFFIGQTERLIALMAQERIPIIHFSREFVLAGGLMSYGGSAAESHRLAGVYTGRILKGERPANLPVQQITKVELIFNLKAAKALDIAVPASLLARADEVIE
jgi:putative ABC transport system substrate-binding protein